MSDTTSRTIEANGLAHHVIVWDGPRERTVVALHGYLDQAQSLTAICERIAADGLRVVALDFRGHGRTQWVPAGAYYHFPDYVADLAAVLDVLAPHAVVSLVAHSMGGSVATMFAGACPERVRALALLEGFGPPPMPADVAPDRTRRWLEALARPNAREPRRMASLEEVVERLRATHGTSVPEAILGRVAGELTRPHPSGVGLAWRFDPLHQTMSPARFDADAFESYAARIEAPVLMVDAGASGADFPGLDARRAAYRNASRVTLECAGHMMHWTEPERTARAVVDFLRSAGA